MFLVDARRYTGLSLFGADILTRNVKYNVSNLVQISQFLSSYKTGKCEMPGTHSTETEKSLLRTLSSSLPHPPQWLTPRVREMLCEEVYMGMI